MFDEHPEPVHADDTTVIPISAGGERAYLAVRRLGVHGDETEIAARFPSFDEVVGKVTALASGAVDGLRATGASKVVLEFGCEIGIEAGQIVAIIGKASGKSTFKVGLEWSEPKTGD